MHDLYLGDRSHHRESPLHESDVFSEKRGGERQCDKHSYADAQKLTPIEIAAE